MNIYLLHPEFEGFSTEEIHVIKAENKEEARRKAIEIYASDKLFVDYIKDMTVLTGFGERFFKDEAGRMLDERGNYKTYLLEHFGENEEQLWRYARVRFEIEARKFFGDEEELADLYVQAFLDNPSMAKVFPKRLFEYILDKNAFRFFGGLIIKEVNLD